MSQVGSLIVVVTDPVRFSCHVESSALELAEGLKEDSYEGGDVFCGIFGRALRETAEGAYESNLREFTYDGLSVVCIREADADRLVNEEDVRVLVPGVRVERDVVNVVDPAGTW